jgi:hypothetical protein
MQLLIYRETTFPSQDLILPCCARSKRICKQNNLANMSIGLLKELERKGYSFKYKIIQKNWRNGQGSPVHTHKVKNVTHFRKTK